jgi:hypothetical protein
VVALDQAAQHGVVPDVLGLPPLPVVVRRGGAPRPEIWTLVEW